MGEPKKRTETDFVTAYCYCYGESRAKAKEVYKTATTSYICSVIASFEKDVMAAFCDD